MRKLLILFTSLLSLTSLGFIKKNALSSKNYTETTYKAPSYYQIKNFVHSFDSKNEYLVGEVPLTIKLINTQYYVGINYIDKNNKEINLIEETVRDKVSSSNKNYTLDFKLPLANLKANSKITIYIEAPLLRNELEITYNITNPKEIIDLSENNKIYYNFEYFNNTGKNYFYEVVPTSFIECEKNIFYFDYFSFKDFYIESNYSNTPNPYLYIYDKSTLFLNVFTTMSGESTSKKFTPLILTKDGNKYYIGYKNKIYLNKNNNIMYLNNLGNYIEVEDRIYMPSNYYYTYKDFKIGIYFKNFSSFKYRLTYEIEVHFEENYRKEDSVIYKEYGYVTQDDVLEGVKV